MIQFHPDDNLLTEYAAGTLERGLAIGVKTHISLCTQCQRKVSQLNTLGAAFFEYGQEKATDTASDSTPDEIQQSDSFAALMNRIHSEAQSHNMRKSMQAKVMVNNARNSDLPPIVHKLLPLNNKVKWNKISKSLSQANLITGQNRFEVCLHKIRQGGKVIEHDHRGREMTVVLRGAFSDESGTYHRGDFVYREPGQVHRPTATEDQDCLCLSVSEAPVKLRGILGLLLNPFLPFKAA